MCAIRKVRVESNNLLIEIGGAAVILPLFFFLQQKEKEAVCEKLFATEEIVTDSKQLDMKRTGHTGHNF